jgi:ribosomal protein L11 methylase PrmA
LANVSPSDIVLDIGSGDGRIVFAAVNPPFAAARAIGVDIDPTLVAHAQRSPLANFRTTFLVSDWVDVDMTDVTVVTLFFLPHESIARSLRAKCRPGTRIVTYVFEIPEWRPVATCTTVPFLTEQGSSIVYLYQI